MSHVYLVHRGPRPAYHRAPFHPVMTLPNGSDAAFAHDRDEEPWTLIGGAVWWDDKRMPAWLRREGVIYPPDEHSRRCVLGDCAGHWYGDAEPPFWPPVAGGEG